MNELPRAKGPSDGIRIIELEAALQEANETLDAIRNGEVDAVVVSGPVGQVVYTLQNADRPYRVLVEQMKEGAVTLSSDGTILFCNASFSALVGKPSSQIVGGAILDHVVEREQLSRMLIDPARSRSGELSILAAEGAPTPVNVSIVELMVEEGAQRQLSAIITDLSQIKARARELSEANTRLAGEIAERTRAEQSLAIALDAADMGSWDLRLDDDSTVRTARHDAIFGHEVPEPRWGLSQTLDHFVAEDRAEAAKAFENARTSGKIDLEGRIRRAGDGAERWVHLKGRTFYGDEGPERIAGVVVDITESRLIEQQLRQGQKMEAIGKLTGGIAHDFNNLLMIIGGCLESLARRVSLDERATRLLDGARSGVARGAKLNQQLLAFARRQDLRQEAVCINDLLPNFEVLLDRSVGETVVVEIRQQARLWHCSTDPHQLETAILNLAINARDAMDGRGRLILSTANVTVSKAQAEESDGKPGDYVVVSVRDTGAGMTPEIVSRIFEPFFTTKGLGGGTGLGLSQVYGFARQSGGFVGIDTVVGVGTTVSIYLPRVDPKPQEPEIEVSPSLPMGDGTVLLVEDDDDVRAASRGMLEDLGYQVREAASGQQALDLLREVDGVDIVFSDVIMASGMTGVDLAQILSEERPDLPVLLTSGYTAQRVLPTTQKGDQIVLHKPYTLQELSAALTSAVESHVDVRGD
jgi:PAS domain S-box-containing protein